MTPRVLGIDASLTRCGIALGSSERIERCTHAATSPADGCRELRIDFILQELRCVLRGRPDLVVIEAYAHGRVTSSTTLGELGGVLRRHLWLNEVPWVAVVSSTVKKFATGSGGASKKDMIAAALPYWPEVANHDEADALHLCRYGSVHYDELAEEARS